MIVCEVEAAIHQGHMSRRLRKIAEQPLVPRVVAFGQQYDIIAQSQQALKQDASISLASEQTHGIGQPRGCRRRANAPAGAYVSALMVMRERTTASRHGPL
jgi:hypothetical protein